MGTIHAAMTIQADVNPTDRLDPVLLRLFADPLRAELVSRLAASELCTCHLADDTGALPSAVSNHLRRLREAGVVETERRGRYTYYRLRPDVLEALAAQFADLARVARSASHQPCR
ncbi:MAG: transcriptional regulator [Nocardioidaceae bacterium]|nr:transcriptional regulator [Nocardioidaceae bacterium]